MLIKAIIVDDEEYGRDNLKSLVEQFCKKTEIIALAAAVASAKKMIREHKPDVVFLDVQMPHQNGFELLDELTFVNHKPLIVFVTAYDQFAIKAIKAKAFDYILKPVDIDELIDCEQRLLIALNPKYKPDNTSDSPGPAQVDINGKISISHSKGIKLLLLRSIVYFEADKNYTIIHIKNENGYEKFVVSRNLGFYESILPASFFFRVHYSFIINVAYMKEYVNTNNGSVVMQNGTSIELSRRRGSSFRLFLKEHNQNK